MAKPTLDDRGREVLKAVIQLHVATGEPVGSESLARVLGRAVSPATLRNVMADLEALGYLEHPHTSAGRMPTDEGYRFYVDTLMGHRPLGAREAAAIASELRREGSPSRVIESASHLLSRLCHSVGFALAPDLGQTSFHHIEFVRLQAPQVLTVMVSRTGIVTNKVIVLDEQLTQDELQACANYLNAHFAGLTLGAIRERLLELMSMEMALYDSLLKNVVALGRRAFTADGEGERVYIDGASNILDHPEFEDIDRMRALFRTFEEKSRLVKILNACLAGDGLRVLIGHENPDPDLADLAVVSACYPLGGGQGFGVGVLGSTRMEYGRVMSLVDHVARRVAITMQDMELRA
jgi:heat-inducible transcriptional repressor